ncbi:MAG: quinone-dependent dihydroorotate dehydrogenase [Porticoccaceae bacterium]|nr:quinone-dependent dihydroorotate dehydrogenase [Porticoccaceae bacterium]
MYNLARKALFTLPAETAHEVALDAIGCAERLGLCKLAKPAVAAPINVMGIDFPNPVGLSAGLDKNGDYFNGLGSLGFGFVEVGTVTPRPQPGNPKPRLFRLPQHNAIINRLGFNNLGVDHLVERVAKRRYPGVLGINIGKNFDTPVENAVDDYLIGMEKVYNHADYITVNISSPNTPGLRDLQFGEQLSDLLGQLKQAQSRLADQHGRYVPLAVKIAPDLDQAGIDDIALVLVKQKIDAVIATNTTIARDAVADSPLAEQAGGLSGAPVREKSTWVIERLSTVLDSALPIIGVGGICSGEDAVEKIEAGASLVQIYTGFIYQGPKLIREAADAIASCNRFQSLVAGSS